MKKTIIVVLVILVVVGIIAGAFISSYNGFARSEADVNAAKSAVGIQLQRRADLIPNFVATVKGYSDYEKSTLTGVTEARAAVGKAQSVSEIGEANAELDKAIDVWVNAVTEAYPDLKASAQYVKLQDELAGTENRIAVARKDYNDEANAYNKKVRTFPSNIVASMFGFEKVELFTEDEGASAVPKVEF